MRWLFTDDRTGERSATALRTWILFLLLVLWTCLLATLLLCDQRLVSAKHFDLLYFLGFAALGGAGAYGFKRFNEHRSRPRRPRRQMQPGELIPGDFDYDSYERNSRGNS